MCATDPNLQRAPQTELMEVLQDIKDTIKEVARRRAFAHEHLQFFPRTAVALPDALFNFAYPEPSEPPVTATLPHGLQKLRLRSNSNLKRTSSGSSGAWASGLPMGEHADRVALHPQERTTSAAPAHLPPRVSHGPVESAVQPEPMTLTGVEEMEAELGGVQQEPGPAPHKRPAAAPVVKRPAAKGSQASRPLKKRPAAAFSGAKKK